MALYQKIFQEFKSMYYANATLGIIASSCSGSVAAMLVLQHGHDFVQMLQLFSIVVVCMGFNATVLANLNPKIVFKSLLLSVLTSAVYILYYFLILSF